MEGNDSTISYHTWGNRANAFSSIGVCASMLGNKAQSALFAMRAEMLSKHRTDVARFAANTDQAMCLLLEDKPKDTPRQLVNLSEPDTDWGKIPLSARN